MPPMGSGITLENARFSGNIYSQYLSTGATPSPQCPANSVVIPCPRVDSISGYMATEQSEWECILINPGVTSFPLASSTCTAAAAKSDGSVLFFSFFAIFTIFAIFPSFTKTSASYPAFPVPSITMPPLIRSSAIYTKPPILVVLIPCFSHSSMIRFIPTESLAICPVTITLQRLSSCNALTMSPSMCMQTKVPIPASI